MRPSFGIMELQNNQIPTTRQGRGRCRLKTPYLHTGSAFKENFCPGSRDTAGGPLSGHHKQLVSVLGMARIEMLLLPCLQGLADPAPPSERAALARAFVAKAVF